MENENTTLQSWDETTGKVQAEADDFQEKVFQSFLKRRDAQEMEPSEKEIQI